MLRGARHHRDDALAVEGPATDERETVAEIETGAVVGAAVSRYRTTAALSTAMASRKWAMTEIGLR